MSWSNDTILEFLELYKSERLLWDPRHPLHRNRSVITDAWLRIQSAISINCTVKDLKKKKESLMTSFRMHWNKKKKYSGIYNPSWFAFPLMKSFLGEVYGSDSSNALEEEFFNDTGYTEPDDVVPVHQYTGTSRSSAPHVIEIKTTKQPRQPAQNFEKADFLYAKKQMNEAVTYLKNAAGEKKAMDEYDLYGQLLVKKLRKLDEHQRDVAMHEIDNIMFRAKMQSSKQRSYSNSPSPVQRKMKSPLFIVTQPGHQQYEDENVYQQDPMQTQHAS